MERLQGVSATLGGSLPMRHQTEEIQLAAHLTNEQRQLAWRLSNKGWSLRAIAKEVGCSYPGIRASLLG